MIFGAKRLIFSDGGRKFKNQNSKLSKKSNQNDRSDQNIKFNSAQNTKIAPGKKSQQKWPFFYLMTKLYFALLKKGKLMLKLGRFLKQHFKSKRKKLYEFFYPLTLINTAPFGTLITPGVVPIMLHSLLCLLVAHS